MKILQPSQIVTDVSCYRFFQRIGDTPGSGYYFTCDQDGKLEKTPGPSWVTADGPGYRDQGIQRYEHSYRQPAVGECLCGREVVLAGFTNTCDCGRDWNSSGQLLGPREQWGEETGETLAEILQIK